jgi:hypothetical protein
LKNYTPAKERQRVATRMMAVGRIATRNKMRMGCRRKVMPVATADSVRTRKKRINAITTPNFWRQMRTCSPLHLS